MRYSNIENLVFYARSEMIGYAIDTICSWFQVSGFRFQVSVNPESETMVTDLVAAEGQKHRRKKAHFMSDSDTAGRVRLLTPDTRNLKP